LALSVEFRDAIAAADRPAASARARLALEHLHAISGMLELDRRDKPASPAPRITTDAPLGSPSSFIGPLYGDSAAKPSVVIA
jgi:hypothetical protein